jgi:hypothetical protein
MTCEHKIALTVVAALEITLWSEENKHIVYSSILKQSEYVLVNLKNKSKPLSFYVTSKLYI